MILEIQCLEGGESPRTLVRAVLIDGIVRLIGRPDWVDRCECVRGRTPHDGALYLRALQQEYPYGTSAAYGAPFATTP